MGSKNVVTSADNFAATFMGMLEEVDDSLNKSVPRAVDKTLKYGVQQVKAHIPSAGIQSHTGNYVAGVARKWIDKGGRKTSGEIGNKKAPGLAHLLEKGHATIGGNRTRAYPHIAPAAEETFVYLEEQIKVAIEEAL